MVPRLVTSSVPMFSQLSARSGIALSVLAHLGLVGAVLLFAEVRPFADVPEQRIEVDVVTADEAPPPAPDTKPEQAKPEPLTPNFDVSSTPTDAKPSQPSTKAEAEPKTKPPAEQPKPKPAEAPQKPPSPKPQQAAAPAQPPQPAPQSQAAATPAAPYPAAIPQEPDVTVKYSVMLGLPAEGGGGFDAPAETVANITAESAAALRKRLKSCAALPPGLSPSDNVKIVLRVALQPDGRLAQEPVLIEGTASAKGPALMKGATEALTTCQPYTMLPVDKYKEWKVLDLSFTPQDFRGG